MKNNKFSLIGFEGLETREMSIINGGKHGVEPVRRYSTAPHGSDGDTDCKDVYSGGIIRVYF